MLVGVFALYQANFPVEKYSNRSLSSRLFFFPGSGNFRRENFSAVDRFLSTVRELNNECTISCNSAVYPAEMHFSRGIAEQNGHRLPHTGQSTVDFTVFGFSSSTSLIVSSSGGNSSTAVGMALLGVEASRIRDRLVAGVRSPEGKLRWDKLTPIPARK
jgi:hypothetical protein